MCQYTNPKKNKKLKTNYEFRVNELWWGARFEFLLRSASHVGLWADLGGWRGLENRCCRRFHDFSPSCFVYFFFKAVAVRRPRPFSVRFCAPSLSSPRAPFQTQTHQQKHTHTQTLHLRIELHLHRRGLGINCFYFGAAISAESMLLLFSA